MLPKAHRLRRSSDFAVALRGGRKASRGSLVVHIGVTKPACAEFQPARVGFIVSKAVGGAVARNLVKRRLRHLVGERLAQLPAGTSLVVRALPKAATSSYATLGNDLDAAIASGLRHIGLSGQ